MLENETVQMLQVVNIEDAVALTLPDTVKGKVRVWVAPVGKYLTKTRVWSILEKDGTREGVVTDG